MTSTRFSATRSAAVLLTAIALLPVAAQAEVAKFDSRTNSYCVSQIVMGSMIPHRICATRQEWLDRGGREIVATQPRPIALASTR